MILEGICCFLSPIGLIYINILLFYIKGENILNRFYEFLLIMRNFSRPLSVAYVAPVNLGYWILEEVILNWMVVYTASHSDRRVISEHN